MEAKILEATDVKGYYHERNPNYERMVAKRATVIKRILPWESWMKYLSKFAVDNKAFSWNIGCKYLEKLHKTNF